MKRRGIIQIVWSILKQLLGLWMVYEGTANILDPSLIAEILYDSVSQSARGSVYIAQGLLVFSGAYIIANTKREWLQK